MKFDNDHARSQTYKAVMRDLDKIEANKISKKMTKKAEDALVKLWSVEKGEVEGKDWKEFVKGQRWYVQDLQDFSAMDENQMMEKKYRDAFADVANEEEMVDSIKDRIAAMKKAA